MIYRKNMSSLFRRGKRMKKSVLTVLLITAASLSAGKLDRGSRNNLPETANLKQLTTKTQNHYISPYGGFSPDGKWIVYDTRADGPLMGSNPYIEKVNTQNRKIKRVYEVPGQNEYGPGCGTPAYHPFKDQIIFIRGIKNASKSRPYDLHRRTCVMVDENAAPGKGIYMDARDVYPPFTPGALRGGTHAHQFSGCGEWIGFTYNDAVMAELEEKTGRKLNLRTVGVMKRGTPVEVSGHTETENNSGRCFSVVVSSVVPDPEPGSNQISRAFSNAWVGENGYRKKDGTYQPAQAYLGKLKTESGEELVELFISDIPENIQTSGRNGAIEGTKTQMPSPPEGVKQRRLTYTGERKYPGIVLSPRHWVLSSSDGKYIAYLAKDNEGVVQLFAVSPAGGEPIQLTKHDTSVQDTFFWKPGSHAVCYVCDNSVFALKIKDGRPCEPARLTKRFSSHPINPCWSRDGSMIAFNLDTAESGKQYRQIFLLTLSEDTNS
ncbi:translocation protein TolB [Sedimentisphaera salicampi]|uniref:Translocation protein TolB n=2 Tax=Sedimentisphaera salicampi TaxID=1941349 RepID=A0A1W6LMX0_9BACT|nr:translocation protein TolB [Sedimentisphaera salicampi]